jgi:hypothetical protein
MTVIYVENDLESGNVIKIVETFRGHTIQRDLKPGENARVSVSRYKSIIVEEVHQRPVSTEGASVIPLRPAHDTWPSFLERRCG